MCVLEFGFRISDFLRPSAFGIRVFPAVFAFQALSAFAVTNSSPGEEIPALRPPHPEIPPTFWEQHRSQAIPLIVLLMLLVAGLVWWTRKARPAVIVPPEVQARRALEGLQDKPEDGQMLSQVSQILCHYLGAVFGMPPGEQTTAEFCQAITASESAGPELATAAGEFLRQCDVRKFAPGGQDAAFGAVPRAMKLIEQAEARRGQLNQSTRTK